MGKLELCVIGGLERSNSWTILPVHFPHTHNSIYRFNDLLVRRFKSLHINSVPLCLSVWFVQSMDSGMSSALLRLCWLVQQFLTAQPTSLIILTLSVDFSDHLKATRRPGGRLGHMATRRTAPRPVVQRLPYGRAAWGYRQRCRTPGAPRYVRGSCSCGVGGGWGGGGFTNQHDAAASAATTAGGVRLRRGWGCGAVEICCQAATTRYTCTEQGTCTAGSGFCR